MRLRLRAACAAAAVLLGAAAATGGDLVQDFIQRHWSPPLAPQGASGRPARRPARERRSTRDPAPQRRDADARPSQAEFCRSCHQFTPDGFALNGKLLQATYDESKASQFARAGVQCQDCHMPDRRHRWRGIHDAEMVRSGLTIEAKAGAARYRPGELALVTLRVSSTRVGHAFPTYVTPRVVLSAELLDDALQVVAGSRREQVIGREVALDLSRELFDARLMSGQSTTLTYRVTVEAPGMGARVAVEVEPDAFYVAFFEALLRQGAGRGEAQIRQALDAARRSPFTVFERELPLSELIWIASRDVGGAGRVSQGVGPPASRGLASARIQAKSRARRRRHVDRRRR
jgi:hypothetical protein